jgi:osmotically-inducible protein OsmY
MMNGKTRRWLDCRTCSGGWLSVCVAAMALLMTVNLAPAISMAEEPQKVTDQDLVLAVETELQLDEAVPAQYLDVTATDGIVTLSGTVSNILARDRAVNLVRSVRGVRAVIDRITVIAVQRPDEELSRDVDTALAKDPATDSYEISADAKDGVVTLAGTVDSYAEKQLAAEVAKGVRGVKEVNNDLTVEYRSQRSDEEIARDIRHRMEQDVYLDPQHVEVDVAAGEVTLTGIVGSAAEKQRAFQDAWVANVTGIDMSGLEVRLWAQEVQKDTEADLPRTDEQVQQAVTDAFRYDPRVADFDIVGLADRGTVTLTGVVDNMKAKQTAEEDAMNTAGVWRVDNHIRVRPENPPGDAGVLKEIEEALSRDAILSEQKIGVQVSNQKVILDGAVDSYFQKYHAQDVAFRVLGVADVKNHLEVTGTWEWKSDQELKKDVEDQLYWDFFVDDRNITVSVDKGVVTLTGEVDSWQERRAAVEKTFQAGARSVRCHLSVRGMDRADTQYDYPGCHMWPY